MTGEESPWRKPIPFLGFDAIKAERIVFGDIDARRRALIDLGAPYPHLCTSGPWRFQCEDHAQRVEARYLELARRALDRDARKNPGSTPRFRASALRRGAELAVTLEWLFP